MRIFLMSHLGSDSDRLFQTLQQHPDIDGFRTNYVYDSPLSFEGLEKQQHKNSTSASIYMDEILHNYRFQRNMIDIKDKFIFYFGEPKSSINKIDLPHALDYYMFRLQGMYEFILRTKGLVMHWNNWNIQDLTKYLNITYDFIEPQMESVNTPYSQKGVQAVKAYEGLYNLLQKRNK